MSDVKTCPKCGKTKPYSEFHRDRTRPDGFRACCKSCIKEYQREYFQRPEAVELRRKKQRRWQRKYRQRPEVKAHQATQEYKEQKRERDRQWREQNRERLRERDRQWREQNRERMREHSRRWREQNRERAREIGRASEARYRARKRNAEGDHTAEDVQRIGESQNWRCWWCGENCANNYHADHLVPLARGGHNDASNIVISCPSCNTSKRDLLPEEFAGRLL